MRVLDRDAWQGAEELMRSLVERVAATTGAEVDVDYVRGVPPVVNDPRAVALLRAAALETVGTDHLMLSPQSMGGEDFGWFADVMPIALARLGTHGGGPPLDLHRGTFDVDERAIGVGVRLLARTALHALEADAVHPGRPARTRPHRARPLETLQPDEPSTRGGNPTMSPTDQQRLTRPAHADAEVPAEHEVPDELSLAAEFDAATRDQWRDLVAGVLRKAGREDLPDPVEDALSRTVATGVSVAPLYTAEDAADLPARSASPASPPFVRGARAGAHPESGVPGGWDIRQRHAHPDVAVTKEAIAADLENGVTSLWLVRRRGRDPGRRRSATCWPTCSSTSRR